MVFEWENDLFWIFWLAMFDYHKMYNGKSVAARAEKRETDTCAA